jgi:hypothetical protein
MQRIVSAIGCLALALFALAAGVWAEDDFKLEAGFTALFNGKDLTGWRYKGSREDLAEKTETMDGRIAVEGGVIVMRARDNKGKGGIKVLETTRNFPKAFHLKIEFRASLKSDSGVYIRGPQLQVRDYIRRNEQKHLTRFKNDDWNTLDITVHNNTLSTVVNGKSLTEKDQFSMALKAGKATATLNGKEIDPKSVQVRRGPTAICQCNGEPLETMTTIGSNGPIGLQAETGKFEFRRVRFKELE